MNTVGETHEVTTRGVSQEVGHKGGLITRGRSQEVEHKRRNIIVGGCQITKDVYRKKCTARGGPQKGEHCGWNA